MTPPKKSKKDTPKKKKASNKEKRSLPTAKQMKKIMDKMFKDWKNTP